MRELIIASHNLHKVRELKEMLSSIPDLEISSLHPFPDYHLPQETGTTFEENARLKARHAARLLNKWVLADDSGLVVPALNGAPGLYSARYAGKEATDKENRKKLLAEMAGLQDLARSASFECALALSSPDGHLRTTKGTCEGTIAIQEAGSNGFGYDPLFIPHDYRKTFAQLDESTKNRVSHRRKALDKILPHLECLERVLN
ncbi:MAG: XTP/dITP diphosphatase [Parachlamydiales bacterium]